MTKFVLEKIENIVGKEENVGYQHFLLFPQCLTKALSSGTIKVGVVWERVNCYILRIWAIFSVLMYRKMLIFCDFKKF